MARPNPSYRPDTTRHTTNSPPPKKKQKALNRYILSLSLLLLLLSAQTDDEEPNGLGRSQSRQLALIACTYPRKSPKHLRPTFCDYFVFWFFTKFITWSKVLCVCVSVCGSRQKSQKELKIFLLNGEMIGSVDVGREEFSALILPDSLVITIS
jgi:hypothetical protein